jgi:hypothetical protein
MRWFRSNKSRNWHCAGVWLARWLELREQDRESFLGEVMIIGQYFRNAKRSQGDHRATVGQAVPLVRPSFVECERSVEIGTGLREDIDVRIDSNVMHCCSGVSATRRICAGQGIQEFRKNLVGCDDAGGSVRGRPLGRNAVPRVARCAKASQ